MSSSEGDSYQLEWSEAMNTGVEAIDSDHKNLMLLIIQLSEAIDANKDKEAVEGIFSKLEQYVVQHFSREEALMRQCQYDGIKAHIKSHRVFINTIPELKEKLLSSSLKQVAEEIYLFLFDWLTHHIIGEDMKFSQQAYQHGLSVIGEQPKTSLLDRLSLAISRHVTLSRRVMMISLLPIFGVIALSLVILSDTVQQLNEMKGLQEKFHVIHYASKMNHSLQAERGLSAGYIGSDYAQFAARLGVQRHQTDSDAKQLIQQVDRLEDNAFDNDSVLLEYIESTKLQLSKLSDQRASIDHHTVSMMPMMDYYTKFITILRDLPDNMIHLHMDSRLSNNIIALSAMLHLKEAVGLQRAMGSRVIAGRQTTYDDLQTYLDLMREKDGALGMFQHTASAAQQQYWQERQQQGAIDLANTYEMNFISVLSNGSTAFMNGAQWFEVYTGQMDQILAMSERLLNDLEAGAEKSVNDLYAKLYSSIGILLSLILLTILCSRMLIYSITFPVKRMTRAMTSLSEGNRNIRFNDSFVDDELATMAVAYEKCRISLLQGDLATAVYLHRQKNDLTRKLNEQQIKSAIQDYALDGIITCDKHFMVTDMNASAETLFGLHQAAVIGQRLTELVVGIEDQELNVRFETDAIRSDQTHFHVEVSISSMMLDDFEGFICFVRDVSKRKDAETNIKKLSQAIGQAGESILITDKNGIIEYVNAAFTTLTGYSAAEAIGNTPRLLKSGNQDAAFYQQLWETISAGKTWQKKVVERHKNGSFFPVILTIAPITNDAGVITNFVGSHADISDLENMEAQFYQAQKMEAIGTLVGGIAHDFNNMLAGITGNLYLAKTRSKNMPEVTDKLDNIESLSFRAAAMIQQLLTFARKDMVSVQLMPFTPFVKETMKFLQSSIPENIALKTNICLDPLPIKGDATQMHQVLMNLINNACDAVEGEDNPCISMMLNVFQADQHFVQCHDTFTIGAYAHLSVEDNGCGIRASHLDHLFEPFFTDKEQGKGTGLGLAMVYGAVANHDGQITVDSVEGEGAIFHIYIPLQQANAINSSVPKTQAVGHQEGQGELILLADDQPLVLEVAQEVLESMGYKTLVAENGQHAVDLYQAHCHEIDVCIFDVVMPIMGGDKAAKQIRKMNPEAKIIFATGYDKALLKEMKDEMVITKPFDFNAMNSLIQDILKNPT